MSEPIITLTTDFGEDSPYAAAMKGVILGINPRARLVDLSHALPPQDLRHAAFFLAEAIPLFPPEALHLVVVDPGVGTARRLLYVEVDQHRLLVPDNGVWRLLAENRPVGPRVHLSESRYWRTPVSPTFHGRDILAPVAAHLSLGMDPASLGPLITDPVPLTTPTPKREGDRLMGEVQFVDHFGNLITNIPAGWMPPGGPAKITVEGNVLDRWVTTYGEGAAGELVGLISSSGFVEVALVRGNAAQWLGAGVGVPVHAWLRESLVRGSAADSA